MHSHCATVPRNCMSRTCFSVFMCLSQKDQHKRFHSKSDQVDCSLIVAKSNQSHFYKAASFNAGCRDTKLPKKHLKITGTSKLQETRTGDDKLTWPVKDTIWHKIPAAWEYAALFASFYCGFIPPKIYLSSSQTRDGFVRSVRTMDNMPT